MIKYFFYGISLLLLIAGFILLFKIRSDSETRGGSVRIPNSIFLILLGLVAAAYPSSPYYTPHPEPTPTSSPSPTTSTPTPTPVPIAINSPTNGAGVKGGFPVSGTAPKLGGDRLWLFVWSENAIVKGKVYYRTSDAPIDVTGGIWSTRVGPLGVPGEEIGHTFTLVLVRANPSCSEMIANIAPNSAGEIFIRELPGGCSEVPPPLVVKKES